MTPGGASVSSSDLLRAHGASRSDLTATMSDLTAMLEGEKKGGVKYERGEERGRGPRRAAEGGSAAASGDVRALA